MSSTTPSIDHFLYYGYLPDHKHEKREAIFDFGRSGTFDCTEEEMIEKGKKSLSNMFEESLENIHSSKKHIVPLSGGLDSRMLLGGLLRSVPKDNIFTVTYGSPGTWDFEIPTEIATTMNINHQDFDLRTDFEWSEQSLRQVVRSISTPVNLFLVYPNWELHRRLFKDNNVIWSGFMGDPPAGGHVSETKSNSWSAALDRFTESNCVLGEISIGEDYNPRLPLPDNPFVDQDIFTFDDQLDFFIRQANYIRPVNMPTNSQYITPFHSDEWISFWSRVPHQQRRDRHLYKKIFSDVFPELANFPTDDMWGVAFTQSELRAKINGTIDLLRSRFRAALTNKYQSPDPNKNYMDFNAAFRYDEQFKKIAESTLTSLNNRNLLNFNVINLWERQQNGQNIAREIQNLISLELWIDEKGSFQ